jgi:hypothetical protein
MLKSQFFKKLSVPEFNKIAGKYKLNLVLLIFIILISLITIGLGKGSTEYLKIKMNDPFITLVSVTIPMELEDKMEIKDIAEKWNENHSDEDNFYSYFGTKEPIAVFHEIIRFYSKSRGESFQAFLLLGRENDPILETIESKYEISENNDFDPIGWGCVVTEDFLTSENKLGLENTNASFVQYVFDYSGEDRKINIPIQGIVKSLPENRDMIIGKKLFDAFNDPDFFERLIDHNPNYMSIFVRDKKSIDFLEEKGFTIQETQTCLTYEGKLLYKYDIDTIEQEAIINQINQLDPSEDYVYPIYRFSQFGSPDPVEVDKENFLFQFAPEKLDKISEFNDYLRNTFCADGKCLEIDMSTIEARNNFLLFNKLANLLSFALIFFSIYSIVIYITNIVLSHISKNKKNLGTLKAFGLSNTYIIIIYSTISIVLISIAFTLSYLISRLLGQEAMILMANYMEITDVNEFIYISYPLYILVLSFIILPSVAIFIKLKTSLHSSTPGDLIYDR